MSYEIVWEKDGVKVIATGVFGNDFLQASVEATTDSRFICARYAIVDFNRVTDFPVETETIRLLAESDIRAYKLNPNLKLAIVANETIMTGLTNMYKLYFEFNNANKAWEMNVFESESDTRDWINN